MLERLQNEVGNIQNTVKELVAMEEVLKGAGGSAIRGFYSDVHLPFLHFFLTFSDSYKQKLQQIEAALLSLEPDTAGYILEQFLEGELEQGLTLIANITERLTNEANSIMDTVSDIVALLILMIVRYKKEFKILKRNVTTRFYSCMNSIALKPHHYTQ